MRQQHETRLLGPGLKSVSLDDLPASAWTWFTPHEGATTTEEYVKSVPWLWRAVQMRAQAVASLPFAIVKKGAGKQDKEEPPVKAVPPAFGAEDKPEDKKPDDKKPKADKKPKVPDYDISENWENKIGCMPDPSALLWHIEAALCVYGYAYVLRNRTQNALTKAVRTSDLRYLLPTSIAPIIDQALGLTGFTRQVGATIIRYAPEDVLYFWSPDAYVEYGPSTKSPCIAALNAAGVLYNVDRFAAEFFASGAIKATLLKVPTTSSSDQIKELKSFWKRLFSGIQRAWSMNVVSSDVEIETIGEGISELSNTELVANKREDISTALGIPHSLLFSNASNFATAQQDDLHFYSKTIVPEAEFIAGVLNSQMLDDMGLRWEFRPETLDAYQEDETQRAQALGAYVTAGMKLSIAAQILGVELPEGIEFEDLDPEPQPPPIIVAAGAVSPGGEPKPGEGMAQDLERWQRKAVKRAREGKAGPVPFESEFIPAGLKAGIEHNIALLGPEEAFAFLKKKRTPYVEPEDVAKLRVRVQKAIAPILARYQAQIADAIEAGGLTEALLDEMGGELRAALTPELALIIGRRVSDTTSTFGITFDAALVNAEAIAWAQAYSYKLVSGLTDTTRKLLQQAVSTFLGTPGMTRGQLESLIEPAFGAVRAEMIAVTEVTRAYSEATAQQQEWLGSMGIRMRRVWLTLNDELVCPICPICGPFHGRAENERGVWEDNSGNVYDGPPAHPNCRCAAELELAS